MSFQSWLKGQMEDAEFRAEYVAARVELIEVDAAIQSLILSSHNEAAAPDFICVTQIATAQTLPRADSAIYQRATEKLQCV